jgi:Fe2+ or Zn2+ uptake regulation protein
MIYNTLKADNPELDVHTVQNALTRLVELGKVENFNQNSNCNMYSRAALARVREHIAEKEV